MPAPTLARHEGSWVLIHKASRQPVMEFYCKANADKAATLPGYEVLTIGQWLSEFNATTARASRVRP